MIDQTRIDEPLTLWYCDACDKPVLRTSEAFTADGMLGNVPPEKTGVVAWEHPRRTFGSDGDVEQRTLPRQFRVLHKITCDTNMSEATWETDRLLGPEGVQCWAELLWNGPTEDPLVWAPGTSLNPPMELLFRFQVPYYEQARRYLHTSVAQLLLGGRHIMEDAAWRRIITEGIRETESS